VQDALPIVIVAVVVLAGLVAVATLLAGRGAYDHIGRGGMTFDRELAGSPTPSTPDSNRDDEIRQMLEARNARRVARGREPLDVEAELAALTRPATKRPPDGPVTRAAAIADHELRAEVRAFVESRNARRVARDNPPLDVEAEIERRLSGSDG
jgi:hypothetical protein